MHHLRAPPCATCQRDHDELRCCKSVFQQSVHVGFTVKRSTWIVAHHWRRHPALAVSICTFQPDTTNIDSPVPLLMRRVWYVIGGRRHYKGPQSNRTDVKADDGLFIAPTHDEKSPVHHDV